MRPDRRSSRRLPRAASIGMALLALALNACAPKPPPDDPDAIADYKEANDPLEPTNRVFYGINNALDTVIMRPLALAYRYAVPSPVRDGMHNVLSNLGTPATLANDILQGKPDRAGDTTARFVINSTAGVLGIFDPATKWGYPSHDSDFGLTLAVWGVGGGPFLFLPVLGPTNPRDAIGFGADTALDPFTWMGPPSDIALTAFKWSRYGLNAVDARERYLDATSQIKKTALDPYATFRSLFRQHRQAEVRELENDHRATIPDWFNHGTDDKAK